MYKDAFGGDSLASTSQNIAPPLIFPAAHTHQNNTSVFIPKPGRYMENVCILYVFTINTFNWCNFDRCTKNIWQSLVAIASCQRAMGILQDNSIFFKSSRQYKTKILKGLGRDEVILKKMFLVPVNGPLGSVNEVNQKMTENEVRFLRNKSRFSYTYFLQNLYYVLFSILLFIFVS